jgi:putative transposase
MANELDENWTCLIVNFPKKLYVTTARILPANQCFLGEENGYKVKFIQLEKPTQNVFFESFNGKFRNYCLNLHWFACPINACSIIENWQKHFNHVSPHRSLSRIPPVVFAARVA